MCEQKRRYLRKDEKTVKLGFWVYCKFYELNYRGQKPRTYEQFMKSQFYIAFTEFGKYLHDINAVNPQAFTEFLMKTGVPIDKWRQPVVYETYMRELAKKETASAALERNFLLMQQWSVNTGEEWTDFFRKVAPAQATLWIKSGRISPWVLYTAPSAVELMARMSPEQMQLIETAVDPRFWAAKLDTHKEEVESIREELEAVGL